MLFRGYIDESYSKNLFTLSCLMATPEEWRKIQNSWEKRFGSINAKLAAQGRRLISRYHAADCSSRQGEFRGWSIEEQTDLTKSILRIVKTNPLNVIAYSAPLKDLVTVFPEHKDDPIRPCYALLLKFLMVEFMCQIEDIGKRGMDVSNVRLALVHDRCKYDGILLDAFNSMIADRTFRGKHLFSTITPMSWQECMPLQLADLLAYENFKESERVETGRKRRKTLELMLGDGLGGRSRVFDRRGLQEIKSAMEIEKLPPLD